MSYLDKKVLDELLKVRLSTGETERKEAIRDTLKTFDVHIAEEEYDTWYAKFDKLGKSGDTNKAKLIDNFLKKTEVVSQARENAHYQSFVQTNQEMLHHNNGLSPDYMEAIKDISYERTMKGDIVIHNFPELGIEFAIPDYDKIDLRSYDMSHKGSKSLKNLVHSPKMKQWLPQSGVTLDEHSLERTRDAYLNLAAYLAKRLGVTDTIDVKSLDNYNNNESKYDLINRAVRVVTGQTFGSPYKIERNLSFYLVSFVYCGHDFVGVNHDDFLSLNSFAPILVIDSSRSA